jgi:hypothetical protein
MPLEIRQISRIASSGPDQQRRNNHRRELLRPPSSSVALAKEEFRGKTCGEMAGLVRLPIRQGGESVCFQER